MSTHENGNGNGGAEEQHTTMPRRRHDDSPLDEGPTTIRPEAPDALVDRETQGQMFAELLEARRLGLRAHEATHLKVDACISDVRVCISTVQTVNARLDDIQAKQFDQTTALKNLGDNMGELVVAVQLQTESILKLEKRVARGEEDADATKAAVATALGGEVKAREKLESHSEITLTNIRLTVEEHARKIGRFESFLDKHLPTKTGRAAVVAAGLASAWPIVKAIIDVVGKLQ